jgi:hypothetical protein
MGRSKNAPFPEDTRTGRAFITPCCTASTTEFRVDGTLWLANSVAGHGWSKPWIGSIDDINDTGTIVDADGTERRIFWRPDRKPDPEQAG